MLERIKQKINDYIDGRILRAANFAPKNARAPLSLAELPDTKLSAQEQAGYLRYSFQKNAEDCFRRIAPDGTYAQDAAPISAPKSFGLAGAGKDIIYTFFAKHGFIGWQLCALLSQHWLIAKACRMPNVDALRAGWELSFVDKKEDDLETDANKDGELLSKLKHIAKSKYQLTKKATDFGTNRKIFGIAIAFPIVEGVDTSLPFNPDSVRAGAYKGIAVIDPYWCLPAWSDEAMSEPGSLHFYQPEYYSFPFNGGVKRVHRSHLIISTNGEVADILKPSYYFGGVPLPQMIYERVYAAEKTANEAPLMALTKRLLVLRTDSLEDKYLHPEETKKKLEWLAYTRDNNGVFLTDSDVQQIDTALTDFDQLIMTQYQLVAAIADIPQYKLLGTHFKGLQSTGEGETKNYIQTLQSLQTDVFKALIYRHNLLSMRSDFGRTDAVDITFNPIDMPTERDLAEVEEMKARTDSTYVNAGILTPEEVRARLAADKGNEYNDLSEELPEELDLAGEEDGGGFGGNSGNNAQGGEPNAEPNTERTRGADNAVAEDNDFKESDHPRDDDGKFTDKAAGEGGGKSASSTEKAKETKKQIRFNNGEEANKYFYQNDKHKKWFSELTDKDKEVIYGYTATDDFIKINGGLRNNTLSDAYKENVLVLDKIIDNYELTEPIRVYRAVKPEIVESLKENDDFVDNAFLSTSVDEEAVNSDEYSLLILDIPAGKGRGAYINKLSGYEDAEYEFLLKRKSKFICKGKKEIGGRKIYHLEMETEES